MVRMMVSNDCFKLFFQQYSFSYLVCNYDVVEVKFVTVRIDAGIVVGNSQNCRSGLGTIIEKVYYLNVSTDC